MRFLLAAVVLLFASGLLPSNAQDKEFQLKFSSRVPPAQSVEPVADLLGKDIEKETNGTVKSTMFPQSEQPRQKSVSIITTMVARWHRRGFRLYQPRLSTRPLPGHRRCRVAVAWWPTPRAAARRWMPGIASTGLRK